MTMLDVTPRGNYDYPFRPGDTVGLPDGGRVPLPTTAGYHSIEHGDWLADTKIEVLDGRPFCVYFHVRKPK